MTDIFRKENVSEGQAWCLSKFCSGQSNYLVASSTPRKKIASIIEILRIGI